MGRRLPQEVRKPFGEAIERETARTGSCAAKALIEKAMKRSDLNKLIKNANSANPRRSADVTSIHGSSNPRSGQRTPPPPAPAPPTSKKAAAPPSNEKGE